MFSTQKKFYATLMFCRFTGPIWHVREPSPLKVFCCSVGVLRLFGPAPIAHLVECPLRGTGGHGLDPGPRHTKVVKNGTSCSSLGTQIYGVELGLVDPVSG